MKASWRCLTTLLVLASTALAALPATAQLAGGLPAPGGRFGAGSDSEKNVVSVQAKFSAPAEGQPGQLFITATIEPGWHIYSITQPSGGPIATKIEVKLPPGVRMAGQFRASTPPDSKKEPAFDNLTVETHHGTVAWSTPLAFSAGIDPAKIKIEGKVQVQACDAGSCLPPTWVPFSATLASVSPLPLGEGQGVRAPRVTTENGVTPAHNNTNVGSPSREDATAGLSSSGTHTSLDLRGLLIQLASAFLGGLILNLMPCVLPVISLKILAFMEQAGQHRKRVFALNVWYSLGLLSVFMVLAALAATMELAWGQQFTLPWFKVAMTALVFVMALSFLGVWEIPIPGFVGARGANNLQTQEGPSGAFFKGVFTTILATPCSGPFLGPVFGYLLKQPPYMAYWIFGAVGLGMASPYLVIGAYPKLVGRLPKPGAWMETVQQLMGFLLLATVVYLFNTLTSAFFIPTLALLVGLWFACWWIGRSQFRATGGWRAATWIGGAAAAALVGWFAFTVLLQEPEIPWQPFSPAALERARAEGKTVMVDFTANWCPNCKLNSKLAIETKAVLKLVEVNGVVPLLADWTDKSPVIKKALNDLGCNSIPVLAIWPAEPKEKNVIILSDLLTESQVLNALKEAGPSKQK